MIPRSRKSVTPGADTLVFLGPGTLQLGGDETHFRVFAGSRGHAWGAGGHHAQVVVEAIGIISSSEKRSDFQNSRGADREVASRAA